MIHFELSLEGKNILFILSLSLTGRPPFVAETEEKLYELIKKGEVDFSDPCWETCHESGKI